LLVFLDAFKAVRGQGPPLPACGERIGVREISENAIYGKSPSPDRFAIDLSPASGAR
jgi:hypothetical protein